MKKALFTSLFLLIMLVSMVGTAAAAPISSKAVILINVEYGHKGPIFTFQVSEKFTKAELQGSLHVQGGSDFNLFCTQVDETTVVCTSSKKVQGVNVVVTWGGSTFWTYVPTESPYCYSIWDWWDFTNGEWTDFGPYCQDTPAIEGDIITYTVPDPAGSFESWAEFFEEDVSGNCSSPVPYDGPAYYYPGCPEIFE